MALDIMREKGISLAEQQFDWRDLVRTPFSKLDDDAFTRVHVILMNGIEAEALRFSHACARMNKSAQLPLARVRRLEQHQQTLVNWLLPPDQSPLETTIGFAQAAIEVTASVALYEPDPYIRTAFHFGMLEDVDHLYRYAALMDRVEGRDANALTQCYTDILPGRPTSVEHRAPEDDLRACYDRKTASPLTKLNSLTIMAVAHQTHDHYMTVGPTFADPIARQLYAEIASIEEQHVTQYESLVDPEETWLEKWVLHEACEVYNYYWCLQRESNPRLKEIWERMVQYELGHLHFVKELFQTIEKRDPAELLPETLPDPIDESHRAYIREVLARDVHVRAIGTTFTQGEESAATIAYRERMNARGSPSENVAAGYRWSPGTELAKSNGHGKKRVTTNDKRSS
jgi:hypothetical protein